MNNDKNIVARLDNQLVMKAHYNLSTNEQKLVLFLASRIDIERDDFNVQRVKIKEIERFFADDESKRWGSIYERVDMMCNSITDKKITLPKGFMIDGKPIKMHRYIQWFTDIEPYLDDDGEISLKFQFAESLKDFLLQLKEYVRINLIEVLPMRGKHAIRMYQIFKAQRDKTKKHTPVSQLTYGIDELKGILGIGNKYKAFQDFKRRVLNPMVTEINEYSKEISIDYTFIKTRRRVTGLKFSIFSKKEQVPKTGQNVDYVPSENELDTLTWSQKNAFDSLVDFGVKEGIAFKQILPTIKGANMEGYEDIFIEEAIRIFKKKESKKSDAKQSVGVFVNWWTKKKVFDIKSDLFFQVSDKVNDIKKGKSQEEIDNREVAKKMNKEEFQQWYKNLKTNA